MPSLEALPSKTIPHVIGAATLLRGGLRLCPREYDPQQLCALMLLAGQIPGLPGEDGVFWGEVRVGGGERVEIPIAVEADLDDLLNAALWWPGDADQLHSLVFLHLIDPAGKLAASSASGPSIFQRARALGPLAPGAWKLRIERVDHGALPQTVYWAAVLSQPANLNDF